MNYRRIPLGPLWTNSYTFWDAQGKAFIVDPGGDPADALAFFQSQGLELKLIVLTHGHADHLLGVPELKRRTGAFVAMPRLDEAMAREPGESLAAMLGATQEAFVPDQLLSEGDELTCGDFHIKTLHTPGHTPGSSCFLVTLGEEQILVAGDTLFARSIGRTDLPGGDERAMAQSLKRLKALEGDMTVLPGHGPETSLTAERLHNPFLAA